MLVPKATEVKKVTVNGVEYACPFAHLFRPLTVTEADSLKASIKLRGVRSPILVYRSPRFGLSIIDGINRAEVAAELNVLFVPIKELPEMTDHEAIEEAKSANCDRRQMNHAELVQARQERLEFIVTMRSEGKSVRTIAAATKTSKSQVERDLKDLAGSGRLPSTQPGVPPGTPARTTGTIDQSPPAKVTGRDGKSYPAQKPQIVVTEPDPQVLPLTPREKLGESLSTFRLGESLREASRSVLQQRLLLDQAADQPRLWLGDAETAARICRDIQEIEIRLRELVRLPRESTGGSALPKQPPLLKPGTMAVLKRNRELAAAKKAGGA